ncbi:MAG: hypothetical protein M1830_002331 [Pleopsidium flavum]|nr:MAG: hypothetical protein M1830_002331 [Pleopsidium flavum]
MPATNRVEGRNVHIYDAKDPSKSLGGLILTDGITNANFYAMIDILFIFESTFILRLNNGNKTVPKNRDALQQGNYHIVTTDTFLVNNEPWLIRTISRSTGTRSPEFRDAIRLRDRRCIISGREAVNGFWTSFQAAHIFPLAYKGHWDQYNFCRWITKPPVNGDSINSVQNGLLLRRDIHGLFDSYEVSINPDDNYKIVSFVPDGDDIAGKHLDQRFLDEPDRPVDPLLRWHFRQAVLANMRCAGEPIFEHDFPPGSDMVSEILDGPMAVKRMEFELFSRLAAVQEE